MKTDRFLTSITRAVVAIMAAMLLQPTKSEAAPKPKPPGISQENGDVEILVTGDLFSRPDHTSNADVSAPPYQYDLCRNANLTIGGATGLTLAKVRMFLPIVVPDACSGDRYNGPGFYTKILNLGFGSNPLFAPSLPGAVTLSIPLEHNVGVRTTGQLTKGKWPPATTDDPNTPEDDTYFKVVVTREAEWTTSAQGGWPRTCRDIRFSGIEVVIVGTRNDAHDAADRCDCPVDYDDEPGGFNGSCFPEPDVEDGVGDGLVGDNCPFAFNPFQSDCDGDGIGDACDPDTVNHDVDEDKVDDRCDNCPGIPNPNQVDSDCDGIGDACDPVFNDADGDGIGDACDNCPGVVNPLQEDADNNGIGDACE